MQAAGFEVVGARLQVVHVLHPRRVVGGGGLGLGRGEVVVKGKIHPGVLGEYWKVGVHFLPVHPRQRAPGKQQRLVDDVQGGVGRWTRPDRDRCRARRGLLGGAGKREREEGGE